MAAMAAAAAEDLVDGRSAPVWARLRGIGAGLRLCSARGPRVEATPVVALCGLPVEDAEARCLAGTGILDLGAAAPDVPEEAGDVLLLAATATAACAEPLVSQGSLRPRCSAAEDACASAARLLFVSALACASLPRLRFGPLWRPVSRFRRVRYELVWACRSTGSESEWLWRGLPGAECGSSASWSSPS